MGGEGVSLVKSAVVVYFMLLHYRIWQWQLSLECPQNLKQHQHFVIRKKVLNRVGRENWVRHCGRRKANLICK
jgi:hypothetical protein